MKHFKMAEHVVFEMSWNILFRTQNSGLKPEKLFVSG